MEYITTKEAGKRLGVTVPRIHVLIRSGRLPARRFGREWLIDPEDLVSYEKQPKRNFKLTADQSAIIKARSAGGASPEELAHAFGVSKRTIYRHLRK